MFWTLSLGAKWGYITKKETRTFAISDEKGIARMNLPPGIYNFVVKKEGYEPYPISVQIGIDDKEITIQMKPITDHYIQLENKRIRVLIEQSSNIIDIGELVQESEQLIQLSTAQLKELATRHFRRISRIARKRVNELRTTESAFAFVAGPGGVGIGRYTKKR